MLKDLFEIDISDVPVLGSVEVRNMAFSLSTGDVPTPLTVLEIGSEDIFDIPYQKGLKVRNSEKVDDDDRRTDNESSF